VLVKGGHLQAQEAGGRRQEAGEPANTREAIDVLDDEGRVTIFRVPWITAGNVRGTGCMLSAAIVACLTRGMTLEEAVAGAKRFVSESISQSVV
jgi:hydroxymethylpyrimidine/phosphomethylpyrimidine kinase